MTPIKRKFLLTSGILIISAALLSIVLLYLYQLRISPLMDDFINTEGAIREAERRIMFFNDTMDPELKKYDDDVAKLRSLFFLPGRELEFIVLVEKAAKRNNLSHRVLTTPSADNLQASVFVEGDYQHILKFLREIQNESFFITITGVSLSPGNATIQMKFYRS